MEKWKKIRDFENYEVSNLGRIRNSKGVILKYRQHGVYKERKQVDLYHRKTQHHVTVMVDRIVLETFVENPNPFKYKRVNHIDGNMSNNRLDNLEWVTVADYFDKNVPRRSKYGLNYCDIPDETVKYIQDKYIKGDYEYGALALSRKTGIDSKVVRKIGERVIRKDG